MRILGALLLLVSSVVSAQTVHIGAATGFPPYQYTLNGKPAGLDIELAEVAAKEAGLTLVWTQAPWDDLTALLRLTQELDALTGMEKTGDRMDSFLIGRTLYSRRNLLFVLEKETKISRLEDLAGLAVARDKDAFSEAVLDEKGLKADIRLVKSNSKEEAFAALVAGRVMAAFMPEAVGWTLARQAGVVVRTIDLGDPGSPVGFAFRKDQGAMAAKMDDAVERLENRGVVKALVDKFLTGPKR
jgi:polar amino acid transport system substrate-binding protein